MITHHEQLVVHLLVVSRTSKCRDDPVPEVDKHFFGGHHDECPQCSSADRQHLSRMEQGADAPARKHESSDDCAEDDEAAEEKDHSG